MNAQSNLNRDREVVTVSVEMTKEEAELLRHTLNERETLSEPEYSLYAALQQWRREVKP